MSRSRERGKLPENSASNPAHSERAREQDQDGRGELVMCKEGFGGVGPSRMHAREEKGEELAAKKIPPLSVAYVQLR